MVKSLALMSPVVIPDLSQLATENIIDVSRYCLRFVNNCKKDTEKGSGYLNSNELTLTKITLIRTIQENVKSGVIFNKARECVQT